MKELKEFTVERLEAIIDLSENPTMAALAKIALAAKRVEPVGYFIKMPNDSYYQLSKSDEAMDGDTPLYTTPPLNHAEQNLDTMFPNGWVEFVANIADDSHMNNSMREWAKRLLAATPKPESE